MKNLKFDKLKFLLYWFETFDTHFFELFQLLNYFVNIM